VGKRDSAPHLSNFCDRGGDEFSPRATYYKEERNMTTNGRVGARNGTKPKDPLGAFKNLGKEVLDGYEAAMERAINKSNAIREAEAKFGTPGPAGIEVRREGLLQRENPEDRKRADTLKKNRDRGYLTADHLKLLGGFAVNGQQYVMDVVERLSEATDDLPDELQPIGELLTNVSTKIMTSSYAECLKFLAEMGFLEIAQATPPEQHQQ
jgi:hypothetical protein